MESLAIAEADLNTLENNLDAVAEELSKVVNNVDSVNNQINNIEENVYNLNSEVKGLVKEIQEITILNNARQNIIYNNEQIDKRYGYFDEVRRKTESLLDAINNSNVNKNSLKELRQELILNNPNYWLSNALACLTSWILDDKENTYKELDNALKKNKEKTSAFFCLINLKLGRNEASVNWLETYLNNQDPTNLNADFVSILDLICNNAFGSHGKDMVIEKINLWLSKLKNAGEYEEVEINRWINYIKTKEIPYNLTQPVFSQLANESEETMTLRNNLIKTSSYALMYYEMLDLINANKENKSIDNILNNLIYEYEDEEQIYQKDNLKNNLIIEHNGNREEALKEYEQTVSVYDDKINLLSLLTNIVIYYERYNISSETRKLALSLIKEELLKAYDTINTTIEEPEINLYVGNFNVTVGELDNGAINAKINNHINEEYTYKDGKKFVYLGAFNLVFILCLIALISIKVPIWAALIVVGIIMIIVNTILLSDIFKNRKTINLLREDTRDRLSKLIDTATLEYINYKETMAGNTKYFDELKALLNSVDSQNYLRTSGERNIDIGE